jgi:anion-transporting  ArsA/GET3 family ATPase
MALAEPGRNVLLCEVEGRQGIARMFDVDPLPYEERRLTKGAPDATGRAGQVHALHIDAESALLEYLAMYYKLGRAGKALDRFGVIDFATTIAPGVRDVLLTGKVYEAVQRPRRSDKGRHHDAITYDAVVLDAPPTGRICQFLGVNSELAGLAKVGPIKSQADKVMGLLQSERTAVHLVTILEEMPVQETSDGIAELRAAGLPVGGVVVNMVRPQALAASALEQVRAGTVDPTAVTSELSRAKVDVDAELVDSLIAEAGDHAVRRQLEDEQRAIVAAEDLPTYELPLIPGGVDFGALLELAQLLRAQGMA